MKMQEHIVKKIYRITLIAIFIFAILSNSVLADAATKIYGDNIQCNSGETVEYSVKISGNPGMTAFVIGAVCEDDWIYFGDEVKQGDFTSEGTFTGENDVRFINTAWYNVDGVKGDGTLFTFDVHVSPSAPSGEYPIEVLVSQENIIDGDLNEIEYEAIDGCIDVTHVEPDMSSYMENESTLSTTAIVLVVIAAVGMVLLAVFMLKKHKKR